MADRPKSNTPLSRREHEVLALMAKGLDYIQVGGHLGISASTVAAHCMRAMVRTRTSSLFQLGMWAAQNEYRPSGTPIFRDDLCNCGDSDCDGRACYVGDRAVDVSGAGR